ISGSASSIDRYPNCNISGPIIPDLVEISSRLGEIHALNWSPQASSVYVAYAECYYELLKDGNTIGVGIWNGSTILIPVNNLEFGVYNYTLVMTDSFGNVVVSTVLLAINNQNEFLLLILLFAFIGVGVAIIMIFLIKRRGF
ncbi:MAG: hypothetical protein KAQ65_05570, partial [Candidatus Thorarchaeota archaeon]|nr:hypothetical protein [Candidatus Thorarchaeota archaeon]